MDFTIGCFAAFCLFRGNMRPTARYKIRNLFSKFMGKGRKLHVQAEKQQTKSVGVVFDLDGVIYRNSPTGTFVIPGQNFTLHTVM